MKRVFGISLLAISLFFIPAACFAQASDEEIPPRYSDLSMLDSIKSFFREGEVKSVFSIYQGYDDNVHLNSQRKRDAFSQMFYKTTLTSALGEKLDGKLGYELMSLMYTDASEVNLLRNTLRFGLDYKISQDLKLTGDYRFGVADYVNTGEDDFFDHRIEFNLRQKLPNKFFHSLGYEFRFKDYNQRKIRTAATAYSAKRRDDLRDTVEYEIGKYFPKDLFKIKLQYYCNNSNERYLEYYDYDSYRASVSLTHLFNKSLFAYCSFSRQWRDYASRTLSVDSGTTEWDRTYVITAALYYNLNETVTLRLNYTYRQNWTNEPTGRYSGAITSLGAYFNF